MPASLVTPGAKYTFTCKASNTVADFSQRDNRWIFEDAGLGLHYIKSAKTGVYISYTGIICSYMPVLCTTMKQPWRIVMDTLDMTAYKFLHPHLPFCLDLTWGSPMLETKVIMFQIHCGRNQAWTVKRIIPPVGMFDPYFAPAFRLVNLATKTVAEAGSGGVTGNAKAQSGNQVWFTEAADASKNRYYIKSSNGSYLGVSGAPTSKKAVSLGPTKTAWEIRPDAKDPQLIKIYYPGTDLLLDLTESNAAAGTPVILYPTQNPGRNQQWKIEAAT